ncbi:MAG: NACHT domain-containing protein [Cyanobacteriota bacterium]|nr:NACHT domain-containing protein [Cyanobacteriota bacterium]
MANHSVRVEQQAIKKVKQALNRQNLHPDVLSQIAGLDSQTLTRFFNGQFVNFQEIVTIYSALDLTWEEGDTLTSTDEIGTNGSAKLETLLQPIRQRCCEKIQRTYSQIHLLDGRQVTAERFCADVYTLGKLSREAYASMMDALSKSSSSQDFASFGLGDRQGRIPGLDAANLCNKLIVFGKPGSGKSSFLQYLAIACCRGEFQVEHIPLLLELKALTPEELANPSWVRDWLRRELEPSSFDQIEAILHQGRLLILLDGLDEVPESARRDLQYQIRTFSQRYFKNRFVLTSKTQFSDYTFPTFECVEMAEFSSQQVKEFAEIWFARASDLQPRAEVLARQFIRQLRRAENWRLNEVAVTPFVLGLACWIFGLHSSVPSYPCDFYEQALTLLWKRNDLLAKNIGDIAEIADRFDLLSALAIRSLERGKLLFERQEILTHFSEFLRKLLPPTASSQQLGAVAHNFLQRLEQRDRLVVERGQSLYSFINIEVHQYFIGRALTAHLASQRFERGLSRFTAKSWRDTFFESLARFNPADDLLLHLKRRADEIVADDPSIQFFLTWASQKAELGETTYKPAAVRAFYFSLGIDRNLEPKLAHPLDFSHAVDRAVKSPLHNRKLACWLDSSLAHAFKRDPLRHLSPALALDLILDCLLVTLAHDLDLFLTFAEDRQLVLDEDFHQALQELNAQLPKLAKDSTQYQKWWESHSHTWTEHLRLAIVGYRNIGYSWRFDARQRKLFKQYYQANKFLVEGLYRAAHISARAQQAIEETLLVPIAPIGEYF